MKLNLNQKKIIVPVAFIAVSAFALFSFQNCSPTYTTTSSSLTEAAEVFDIPLNLDSASGSKTCNDMLDELGWEHFAEFSAETVATSMTTFNIAFRKYGYKSTYRTVSFDPGTIGFAIKLKSASNISTTIPSEAYTQQYPMPAFHKGLAYAHSDIANLIFHVGKTAGLEHVEAVTPELYCFNKLVGKGTGINLFRHLNPEKYIPSCTGTQGKVVGNLCQFTYSCQSSGRASGEMSYAAGRGYSSCWNAKPVLCAGTTDSYHGSCPLMNLSEAASAPTTPIAVPKPSCQSQGGVVIFGACHFGHSCVTSAEAVATIANLKTLYASCATATPGMHNDCVKAYGSARGYFAKCPLQDAQEVQTYWTSTMEQRVNGLYQSIRSRNPDKEGYDFWIAEITKGTQTEQALENILRTSP